MNSKKQIATLQMNPEIENSSIYNKMQSDD